MINDIYIKKNEKGYRIDKGGLIVVSVSIPEPVFRLCVALKEQGYITSKAEFIRICVNEYLLKRKTMFDNGELNSFHDFVVDLRRSSENIWNKEDELHGH